MECTGRCVAVSEPDSTNIVATKYRKFGDSPELRQLACDVIRWDCRPYSTMHPAPLGYFPKLTSPSVVILPMLRQRHSCTCVTGSGCRASLLPCVCAFLSISYSSSVGKCFFKCFLMFFLILDKNMLFMFLLSRRCFLQLCPNDKATK